MKNLVLENFRLFQNRTQFELAPITILTGKNNSGKSSVFKALMLLSDFLESNNHTEIFFEGKHSDKHHLSTFKNAKTRGTNDFFSIEYNNEYFIIEIKFEGKDIDYSGLLKTFKITTVENGQYLRLNRLSKTIVELCFTPAFFHAFEHTLSNAFMIEGEIIDVVILKNNLKELNEKIKKISKSNSKETLDLIDAKENILLIDELNKLNSRKKLLLSQIKRLANIYEGSLFEFSTNIDISTQRNGLRIEDLIFTGIKNNLGESKLNELKLFYSKRIGKNYDFNQPLSSLISKLKNMVGYSIHHLAVNRYAPGNYYSVENKSNDLINELIEYTKYLPPAGSKRSIFFNHWLETLGIGIEFKVENIDHKIYFPEVRILPEDKFIKISDLGYGSGQLLTILLKIINNVEGDAVKGELIFRGAEFVPGGETIIIEEPEANLHPKMQSKLAELFYDAWKRFGVKFIIETHSEYLIRKFMAMIGDDNSDYPWSFNREDCVIYYLDKDTSGSKLKKITIEEDGKLTDSFGEGFFDVADDLAVELYRFQKTQK